MKVLTIITLSFCLFGCAAPKSTLTQKQAEATWEQEAKDLGWDKMKFAPLWSAKERCHRLTPDEFVATQEPANIR